MSIIVRMNNVKHAYPGELSFAWPGRIASDALGSSDALADNRGGHTSASLMITDDSGVTLHHLLVDAGIGTLASLNEAVSLSPKRIDAILVTHGDMDHIAELSLIGGMFRRLSRYGLLDALQPIPIPVWSIAEVRDMFQARTFPQVAWSPVRAPTAPLRFMSLDLDRNVDEVPVYRTFQPLGPDCPLRITPVGGVWHRDCVIYVVEVANRKIIFAWDMEKLPWDTEPGRAGLLSEELREILREPDLVVMESNTFERRPTGHICVHDVLRFIQEIGRPDTVCRLVHYSGFEDFFASPSAGARTPIYDYAQLEVEIQKLDPRLKVARAGDEYVL